jgi:hypothetical protein
LEINSDDLDRKLIKPGVKDMLKLKGLYYITRINNLPSILQKGILCHRRMQEEGIDFTPTCDAQIVASRKEKTVAEGRSLMKQRN